ncbi:MAG: PilZ domain-containing protein [Acidobacteriales bacterium]|nr:PilZ domain-containing protein [Terriglobales bacterium]
MDDPKALLSAENHSMQPSPDRRALPRFDMRLFAAIKFCSQLRGEVLAETQNVSARGVFFYLDRAVPKGGQLDVVLTFPSHVTLTEPMRVRFSARVVRIEKRFGDVRGPNSRVGIAATIEKYEFLRSASSGDTSDAT